MNTNLTIAIIGIIGAVFGGQGFWTWVLSRGKRKSAESKLMMGIAYTKIISTCDQYIKQGYIPADEYRGLSEYLFQPYLENNGNGTAKRQIKFVENLPPMPPQEEKHE